MPDTHIPEHDRRVSRNMFEFIADYSPDEIVHTGDFMDFSGPSRWSKGKAEEFLSNLDQERNTGRAWWGNVRAVYDGPISQHLGNHDERPEAVAKAYAPALSSLPELKYAALMDFERLDIRQRAPREVIAPGWLSMHGHQGLRLSRVAGGTALSGVRRYLMSVVCGHTHRAALVPQTHGRDGRLSTLWGWELGHITDVRKVGGYLKDGHANWQQGFGIMRVRGTTVVPEPITVQRDGSFIVEGAEYGRKGVTAG
ncbi:hypothetical protein [Streptomyces sp. NPDC050507]|uniref:hypothetical protein n=1 Tax=Streptomyces sp. NPDC050507 TaxID=3365619 RepID=UPI0037B8C659